MLNSLTKSSLIIFTALVFTLLSFQSGFGQTTIEEKMALVDGNYPLSIKITRYRYLLTTIEKKTGDSKERIGDMTVKAQDILKKQYGKEVTLLDLLEGVNKSIPSRSKVPFAKVIAAYVLFIGQ